MSIFKLPIIVFCCPPIIDKSPPWYPVEVCEFKNWLFITLLVPPKSVDVVESCIILSLPLNVLDINTLSAAAGSNSEPAELSPLSNILFPVPASITEACDLVIWLFEPARIDELSEVAYIECPVPPKTEEPEETSILLLSPSIT